MKLRITFAVFTVLLLGVASMYAQHNCSFIPIRIDAAAQEDTLLFGVHQCGTFGIDACAGESEGPPPPVPGVHYYIWKDPTGAGTFGNGLFKYDFRSATSNPVDSFQLTFQPDAGDTVKFYFPSASYIGARFDSVAVYDYATGTYLLNMAASNSYIVPIVRGNPKYTDFLIYFYGPKALVDSGPPYILSVRLESPLVPSGFALRQNYPNPFNPSTTIKFDIMRQVDAEIAVFDVLGRKVATLASERLMPGTYSTVWNGLIDQGKSVSSGVYYVRMVTHTNGVGSRDDNFSAVRKLLLMK